VLSWLRALLFSQFTGLAISVNIFTGCFKREPVRMVDVSEMKGTKKNFKAEINIESTRSCVFQENWWIFFVTAGQNKLSKSCCEFNWTLINRISSLVC
jgi:hypothetical protein